VPEGTDDASTPGKRSPGIAYRIKTPGQALHDAIGRKDLDGVTRILRASPDIVDAKNDRGRTGLHVAAQNGYNEIVKLLLSKGAEVDSRSKWKYTPLHFAAESSRHDVVVTLLDAGADLERGTRDGKTPLHKAVIKEIKNKQDLLVILLARGANCNALNNEGSTPLQTAVAEGRLSNARALCAFGADPYFKDKHGENAFNYAKRLEGDLGGEMADVMSKWEKCGKQTRKVLPQLSKFVSKEGRVDASEMLSYVSGLGHELLVEFILDYMAKDTPEIVESEGLKKGWRPIHHAAWAGQSHVCQILLSHGAAVDAATGMHKWTPLHLAAWKGRQRTLRVLLDRGAEILSMAELTPPWRVDADSHARGTVVLTKATAFWLAAGGRHPKSLDVLLEYALRIKDDKIHMTAMDDYTKARHHLASLNGQDDDGPSGNDDQSGKGPDPEVAPANSTPSLLPEIDVPGTSGSFDGAFFSVPATR
jgi:cytohesin